MFFVFINVIDKDNVNVFVFINVIDKDDVNVFVL